MSEALESHLRGRTALSESAVEIGGKTYRLFHPADADALIDEAEFARDERLPYWADLWPSAIALSRHLVARNLAGRRVIELGCGIGLPSVVALDRGAEVLATDHYEAALDFAAHNARANAGRDLATALLDWHSPPDEFGRFDLVLAADVLYEERNVPALASLVPRLVAPGGEAVFADPRRRYAEGFLREIEGPGVQITTGEAVVESGGREVRVNLHRFRRR